MAFAAGPSPLSLTQLTRKAGFIFAGRVLRIERPAPVPGTVPVVQITFRVDRAVRGTRRGQTFTFAEWAGAWDNGARFQPGQRVMLFLYPRSKTGLTSVVGGRLGEFALDARGNLVLRADQTRMLFGREQDAGNLGRGPGRDLSKFRYQDFTRRLRPAK